MLDFSEGIVLFNSSRYFEAHDYFEILWKNAEQADRLFCQGLVQVSVGSYHFVNKNYRGALSQFKKAISKLLNYIPEYYGVNISALIKELKRIINILENWSDPGELTKIELPVIVS